MEIQWFDPNLKKKKDLFLLTERAVTARIKKVTLQNTSEAARKTPSWTVEIKCSVKMCHANHFNPKAAWNKPLHFYRVNEKIWTYNGKKLCLKVFFSQVCVFFLVKQLNQSPPNEE